MLRRDAIYITRPERIIWPVIALVALTLFAGAGKATVERLRPAIDAHPSVVATHPDHDVETEQEAPGEAARRAESARLNLRTGTRSLAPDVRAPLRRAARVHTPLARAAERRELAVRSHVQRVVSPRPGARMIQFATAPPRAARARAHAGAA